MTNYEKIKAMSVREVAECFNAAGACSLCAYLNDDCDYKDETCLKGYCKWLESEAGSAGYGDTVL